MDQGFIDILKKLVNEQGEETLLDPVKCRNFLNDYTRGEYKRESRQLLKAVEAGVSKAIHATSELTICIKQQHKKLYEDHDMDAAIALDVVNVLAQFLRKDAVKEDAEKDGKKYDEAIAHERGFKERHIAPFFLEALAEQGHAEDKYNLGVCYYQGQGVPQDYAKAVEWYSKAAAQGYAPAQCNLGFCYSRGQGVPQDNAKAAEWYRKAAEQGHALAQCNLGVCYRSEEHTSELQSR
jgi:hypothetical protein